MTDPAALADANVAAGVVAAVAGEEGLPGRPAQLRGGAIKSNDKKRGRVEAMRHVRGRFDFDGKDEELVRQPDPRIVGTAASVIEHGGSADRVFPDV